MRRGLGRYGHLLLGITVVSLIVALVMSITAWRLIRDDKQRSAARIAALSAAARPTMLSTSRLRRFERAPRANEGSLGTCSCGVLRLDRVRRNGRLDHAHGCLREEPDTTVSHATGFLGAVSQERDSGGGQRILAIAAVVVFAILSGGLVWMMSARKAPPRWRWVRTRPSSWCRSVTRGRTRSSPCRDWSGTRCRAQPVEKLSAVVFLFDRMGTFVASSRADVDFLKLGAGDESPFVVSLEAPATVSRYRVSFRTDDGVVPHIDRRGESPAPAEGDRPVNVTAEMRAADGNRKASAFVSSLDQREHAAEAATRQQAERLRDRRGCCWRSPARRRWRSRSRTASASRAASS